MKTLSVGILLCAAGGVALAQREPPAAPAAEPPPVQERVILRAESAAVVTEPPEERRARLAARVSRLHRILNPNESDAERAARVSERELMDELGRLKAATREVDERLHADVVRLEKEFLARRNWEARWRERPGGGQSDGRPETEGVPLATFALDEPPPAGPKRPEAPAVVAPAP